MDEQLGRASREAGSPASQAAGVVAVADMRAREATLLLEKEKIMGQLNVLLKDAGTSTTIKRYRCI